MNNYLREIPLTTLSEVNSPDVVLYKKFNNDVREVLIPLISSDKDLYDSIELSN